MTTGGFDEGSLNAANTIYGTEEERTTAAGSTAQQMTAQQMMASGLTGLFGS